MTDQEIVRFEARLDMERLPAGKRFQGTILYREGRSDLVVSYRPMEEYFRFVDKRVVVEGYHYSNPPHVQQIMADHFAITAVELAPGETPRDPIPTTLPVPPWVRTGPEVAARAQRWAQCAGTLTEARKNPDDDWCKARLTLADGTQLEATLYISTLKAEWEPLVGRAVTVLGRIGEAPIDGVWPFASPTAVCEGEVSGCGMPGPGRGRRP